MKEIKFRLRNCKNKIVGYQKWYSGSLDSKNFYTAKPCWLYSKEEKYWNPKLIPHRFKDEYTGLKDKKETKEYPKGQEIYKEDIIQDDEDGLDNDGISIVKKLHWFNVDAFDVYGYEVGIDFTNYNNLRTNILKTIEVIGNIYQNPELLENTKK